MVPRGNTLYICPTGLGRACCWLYGVNRKLTGEVFYTFWQFADISFIRAPEDSGDEW
jgi:hypothetical protein